MAKYTFEVFESEAGHYLSRLRDNKGRAVKFRANGLPKDMDAEEERRVRSNVQAALGKIYREQQAAGLGVKTKKPTKNSARAT